MSNPFEEILSELREIKERLDAPPPQDDEIIDRPELLSRLKLTEPTLIRMVKRKEIPEIRAGGSCRYNWPKVVKALEKKQG
jgi:predicted DNA-binding transcriptional regulator AlpA